jgi:hypothetical protein
MLLICTVVPANDGPASTEFQDTYTASAAFMESESSFLSSLAAQLLEGRSPFEVGCMTKWACTIRAAWLWCMHRITSMMWLYMQALPSRSGAGSQPDVDVPVCSRSHDAGLAEHAGPLVETRLGRKASHAA